MTYGYITKAMRSEHNIPKSHVNDALCITGNPDVTRMNTMYLSKKNRVHNRQIQKDNKLPRSRMKLNQAPNNEKGFRLNDKVLYNGAICFITGRRKTGYFGLKDIEGQTLSNSAKWKDLTLLEKAKYYSIQRISRS